MGPFLSKTNSSKEIQYVNDDYKAINSEQNQFDQKLNNVQNEVKSMNQMLTSIRNSGAYGSGKKKMFGFNGVEINRGGGDGTGEKLNGNLSNIDNLITQYSLKINDLNNRQAQIKAKQKDLIKLSTGPDNQAEIQALKDSYMQQINILEKNLLDLKNQLKNKIDEYNLLNNEYHSEIALYDDMTKKYNGELQLNVELQNQLEYLKHHPVQNYDEMYNNVRKQNKILKTQIDEKSVDLNIDDQLVHYQQQKIDIMKWITYFFYWIYHILIFITLFFLFYFNKTLSIFKKIAYILFFIVYPYVIGYVEKMVYFCMTYFYTIIIGEAYNREERSNPMYANTLF